MTPLSEALTTAQKRALAALEKAYVAGQLDPGDDPTALTAEGQLVARLHACGITDPVDTAFLAASLDVLREWGVQAPTMTERVEQQKSASQRQADYIIELLQKGGHAPLNEMDVRHLTSSAASKLIGQLKDGSYKPEEWDVPF